MEQASSKNMERYCPPTNLDRADFGTLCKVVVDKDTDKYELYIQLSQEEKPKWERLGIFFEEVFDEEFISNESFIVTCLDLYKSRLKTNKEEDVEGASDNTRTEKRDN